MIENHGLESRHHDYYMLGLIWGMRNQIWVCVSMNDYLLKNILSHSVQRIFLSSKDREKYSIHCSMATLLQASVSLQLSKYKREWDPQQNTTKQNSTIYSKNYTTWSSRIYSWNAKIVLYMTINVIYHIPH